EQFGEFLFRAFLAADGNHHLNVQQLSPFAMVAGRDHRIGDKNSSLLVHGPPAIREDPDAILIVPVVQDVLQDVSIAAVRNRLEEIARFESAPSGGSRGGDMTILPAS